MLRLCSPTTPPWPPHIVGADLTYGPRAAHISRFDMTADSSYSTPLVHFIPMVLRWCFDNVGEGSDSEDIAETSSIQDVRLGDFQSRIWRGWVAVCFAIWDSFTPFVRRLLTSRGRELTNNNDNDDVRNDRKRRRYR